MVLKFENIKEGDIIEFKSKKGIIIHRVVFIEKDVEGKFLYTTKGDNNLTIDPSKVSQEDVLGIVIGIIAFVSINLNKKMENKPQVSDNTYIVLSLPME